MNQAALWVVANTLLFIDIHLIDQRMRRERAAQLQDVSYMLSFLPREPSKVVLVARSSGYGISAAGIQSDGVGLVRVIRTVFFFGPFD